LAVEQRTGIKPSVSALNLQKIARWKPSRIANYNFVGANGECGDDGEAQPADRHGMSGAPFDLSNDLRAVTVKIRYPRNDYNSGENQNYNQDKDRQEQFAAKGHPV